MTIFYFFMLVLDYSNITTVLKIEYNNTMYIEATVLYSKKMRNTRLWNYPKSVNVLLIIIFYNLDLKKYLIYQFSRIILIEEPS